MSIKELNSIACLVGSIGVWWLVLFVAGATELEWVYAIIGIMSGVGLNFLKEDVTDLENKKLTPKKWLICSFILPLWPLTRKLIL